MATEKKKDVSNIKIEADGDIIFTTVGKYKLFYSYGSIGMDAYLLYSHLQFTARLQGTNSVEAKNKYLRDGLNWGKDRLQKAKNLLNELCIIKNVTRRREDGTISGHYIEIRTTTKVELEPSSDPETHPVGSPDGGSQETNALTNNINALTNNINIYTTKKPSPQKSKNDLMKQELLDAWNSYKDKYPDCIVEHRNINKIKTKHLKDVISIGGIDKVKTLIGRYCSIVSEDKYWYDKPYSGIDRFLDKLDFWNQTPDTYFQNKNKNQSFDTSYLTFGI